MIWNDWRTWATPGASSAASSRVSASRSSLPALIAVASSAGVVPVGGHDRERVRQRGAAVRVAGCDGGEVGVVRDEQRGRDAELGIGRQPDHGQLEPARLDDDRVADVEAVIGVGLAGDRLARLLGEPTLVRKRGEPTPSRS